MLVGVYILVDDEYETPIYADPSPSELDEGLWPKICELVQDVLDGEQETRGTIQLGESLVGWRSLLKTGITFVAVVSAGVRPQSVEVYLQKLAKRYADEVDDWRSPDKAGVADVVIDVIPPWEEDDG
jgi:hypothetical protein